MRDSETFAGRLIALREAAGFTSAELARLAGISKQFLHKIETGGQPDPRLSVAVRLAKALRVSVTRLYP